MSIHSGYLAAVNRVPAHLKQFVVEQDYAAYTAVDQAVWRYVMRQNSSFLETRAHPAYLDGLRESGIAIDSIPQIEEMNRCLSRIGWGAVTVDGFIPPSAFMDFQANRILAIAADIRTLEHIAYTPAPDILHESAGHAPIILDEKYRSFLQLIGEIGAKAFSSKEDMQVYEAIRSLSVVKEDPDSTPEMVKEAEDFLDQAVKAVTNTSEAALVSRLYWWTVEYGLIGDPKQPQIYGAGLLSSVGESISCLRDDVRKIQFDLDTCISTDYDITRPQPQLFVCRDFDQLITAAQQLAEKLAYRIGGTYALNKALASGEEACVAYSSGLQVNGTFGEIVLDAAGEAIYLKTNGPTSLSWQQDELPGQGRDYHAEGFGSPIGKLQGHELAIEFFMDGHLRKTGIEEGKVSDLLFESGIRVQGIVRSIVRRGGSIVLISFDDCTVTYQDRTLFEPEWGTYDMAVGASIVSAFPGTADQDRTAADVPAPSKSTPARRSMPPLEVKRNVLYQTVRDLRLKHETSNGNRAEADLGHTLGLVYKELQAEFPQDWLLRLEMLELLAQYGGHAELRADLLRDLSDLEQAGEDTKLVIQNGKRLVK